MSTLQVVLLVVGILVFVAAIQIAVWVPLIAKLRKMPGQLRDELAARGERIVLGPAKCVYRGSSAPDYPSVRGNGVVALTDRTLAFRRAIGKPIDVPVARIAGVREDKWFLSSIVGGRMHVIAQLRDGGEVGFFAPDNAAWVEALRASNPRG